MEHGVCNTNRYQTRWRCCCHSCHYNYDIAVIWYRYSVHLYACTSVVTEGWDAARRRKWTSSITIFLTPVQHFCYRYVVVVTPYTSWQAVFGTQLYVIALIHARETYEKLVRVY